MINDMRKRVAVIVPVYKVRKDLVCNCIDSIIRQTYKSLEIIIVDDGNDEKYKVFLDDFLDRDERIKIVRHEKNRGLFKARMTGVENSSSEYVTFVDSDDSISIDWIRLLVEKAEVDKSDIVIGNTICEDENHWKYVFTRNYSICTQNLIEGKDVFEYLIKDCGLDFTIHTMWNKLYSYELWKRSWDELIKVKGHLVMTEDILFSFVLFYFANKLSFSDHDGYFYYKNSESSTINTKGISKVVKNVKDLVFVFSSIQRFLDNRGLLNKYEYYFTEWKNRYFRWWSYLINEECNDDGELEELKSFFFSAFNKTDFENTEISDGFFDSQKVTWNCKLENLKTIMINENVKVISFDLFDTLITRPVLNSDDVYEFVLNEVNCDPYEREVIRKIRYFSEKYARMHVAYKYPQYEDITLSEIYEAMNSEYSIPKSLCEKLRNKENEIEILFANKRKMGSELYNLAIYLGKTVYITSDMYLEEETINAILKKNDYIYHDRIFLSSKERLLKSTGSLFDCIIEESGCDKSEILHIGDNWEVDYIKAQEKGIKSYFIPKTKDILFNSLGDVYTGNSIDKMVRNELSIVDNSKHFNSVAVRCLYANAANILFDNPFVYFNEATDYNGNPFYVGCMTLGMHCLGVTKWLYDLCKKKSYEKIHFSSRDGFYLKKIMDLFLNKLGDERIKTNYLYVSRKAFIPLEINKKESVNKITNNCLIWNQSPKSIIKRYHSILSPLDKQITELYRSKGFFLDKKFSSEDEFYKFVSLMSEIQFSEEKATKSYNICAEYLKQNISQNDVIFDLGYSGKLHKDIVEAIGINVHGAYISKDGYEAARRIDDSGMTIESYYDFTPSMQGIVNEYILSDRGPSCIGYERENNSVVPIFEESLPDYLSEYVVSEINRGAYRFVDTFLDNWASRINLFKLTSIDFSLPYERFLIQATDADKSIFECCSVEDEFFGGISQKSLVDMWKWQILDRHISEHIEVQYVEKIIERKSDNIAYDNYLENVISKNKFVKMLYWYCVDKKFLKHRIKEILFKNKMEH